MSFLSYRTRIPRHFDSHANVRSTTHRRGLWPCDRSQPFFSSPIRRMCAVYPAAVAAPSPVGLSYPLSRGMCCGSSFVGSGRSTTILSIVAARSLRSSTFAPAITTPSGPPSPSVTMLFLVPFFPRSVGFLPVFFPPKAGLAQHRVGRLPLPLHPAEFVTLGDQDRPDSLEDPCCSPALEPVVDSALGSVPLGQLVPLAAAAQPEDDRIQHFPPIGDLPPSRFLGPEFQEDRLDPPPQLVGDFPDRTQRFASRLPADHGSVSCRCARKWSLLATSSFLQKVFRRFSDSYLSGSQQREVRSVQKGLARGQSRSSKATRKEEPPSEEVRFDLGPVRGDASGLRQSMPMLQDSIFRDSQRATPR